MGLLRKARPDTIDLTGIEGIRARVIKSNPVAVLATLNNFKAYRSFGAAMTTEQQLTLSANVNKLNDFFKSDDGKLAISIFAEEFSKFVNKK